MFSQQMTLVNDEIFNQHQITHLVDEETKFDIPAAPKLRARESPVDLCPLSLPSLPSSKEFMKQAQN